MLESNLDGGHDLRLKGEAHQIRLASVFNLLNRPVHWDGRADGTFEFSGPDMDRSLVVDFSGDHEGFGPFQEGGGLSGRVRWTDGVWNLSGIRVQSGSGYARLLDGSEIYLESDGSGRMRLLADVRNLEAGVLTLFGRVEMTGAWSGHRETDVESSGLEMDVFARSLYINQFVLDGNISRLRVKDGRINFAAIPGSDQQITGDLEFRNFPTLRVTDFRFTENGVDKVVLDGLVGTDRWDFRLGLKGVDADVIRGIFDTTIPTSGLLEAAVVGKGSVRDPDITADVTWRNGAIGIVPLDLARGHILFKDHRLTVENLTAQRRNGYALAGRIRVDTTGDEERRRPIELNLALTHGDLGLLTEIWPDCTRAKGNFEGQIIVGPRAGAQTLSGFLRIEKASLRTNSYIPSLEHGELSLRLDNDRLRVDRAEAELGKGTARLAGYIDFEGGEPKRFNLSLDTLGASGISVRAPELTIPAGVLGGFSVLNKKLASMSRGEPKIHFTLKGPASEPRLAGRIELENTVFTYPPAEQKGEGAPSAAIRTARGFRDRVYWDVVLAAGARTWYQNESVDARVTGEIHIKGPTSDLGIDGHVYTEQGAIVYFGNEFKIRSAEIEIQSGEAPLNRDRSQTLVYLAATAEKDVYYTDGLGNNNQDTIIMKVDRSLFGEIQPRFYSKNNPNLSSQRAAQLALGFQFTDNIEAGSLLPQAPGSSAQDDTNKQLRVGLVGLLDSSLASPLARALARQTGLVDFIRVSYEDKDPLDTGPRTAPTTTATSATESQFLRYMKGTKVQLGRELSSRLFADYSFRVDEFENQLDLRHEVELAYRVHRNLFLRATSELDSERTLGRPPDRRAILENRWRFNIMGGRKRTPPAPGAPQKTEDKPLK